MPSEASDSLTASDKVLSEVSDSPTALVKETSAASDASPAHYEVPKQAS